MPCWSGHTPIKIFRGQSTPASRVLFAIVTTIASLLTFFLCAVLYAAALDSTKLTFGNAAVVLAFLYSLAIFTASLAWNSWRMCLPFLAKRRLARLQSLEFTSTEFYDLATDHFRPQLRTIRNCGIFLLVLGALAVVLLLVADSRLPVKIIFAAGAAFLAMIGWGTCRLSWLYIKLIKVARDGGRNARLETLGRLACRRDLRTDPVALFILEKLNEDAPPNGDA